MRGATAAVAVVSSLLCAAAAADHEGGHRRLQQAPLFRSCDAGNDWDGDGRVDVDDLLSLLGAFGMTADPGVMRADISPSPNGDGRVDVNDLLAVLALFGCEAVEDVGSGENAVWGDELNGPPVRLVASGFAEPSLNGAFSRIEGVLSCSPADARTPHGTVYKSTSAERFLHRFGGAWYMAQVQCAIDTVYAMFDAGGADGYDGFDFELQLLVVQVYVFSLDCPCIRLKSVLRDIALIKLDYAEPSL